MKLNVEEFKKLEKGVKTKYLNLLHLWLKLDMDWDEVKG